MQIGTISGFGLWDLMNSIFHLYLHKILIKTYQAYHFRFWRVDYLTLEDFNVTIIQKRGVIMKFRWFILLIMVSIISFNNTVLAQKEFPGNCLIKIAAGYGFYKPNEMVKWAYLNGSYGGIGVNIRVLFKTKLFNSRLRLGGGIGGATYATETSGSMLYWVDTGKSLGHSSHLNGFIFQLISDLYLCSIGSFDVQFESGIGFQLFDDPGLEYDISWKPEIIASAKLALCIPISSWATIDPQIGILTGFRKDPTFLTTIALGVTLAWKKLKRA